MIVVLIILALVFIRGSTRPIGEASDLKIAQELAEVKKGVNVQRLTNAKLGTDEKNINRGFIKVVAENAPEGFKSFDEDKVTGYVVDLATIEYTKLATGRGYMDIEPGDTITFDQDDVYIYDAAGNVYYAKGYIVASGDSSYSENESGRKNGPKIDVKEIKNGTISMEVTPVYGGTISSVIVGSQKATTTDGRIFKASVTSNGSYVIIASEENGGTTRTTITVNDIDTTQAESPIIQEVYLEDHKTYVNYATPKLYIVADNTDYMHISVNSSRTPSPSDISAWRTYANESTISLSEGENKIYVWGKNTNDAVSDVETITVHLDTISPTREAPSYRLTDTSIIIEAKQTDASPIKYKYHYKMVGNAEYISQDSNVIEGPVPGAEYMIMTQAIDEAGNSSFSRETKTSSANEIPGGVLIEAQPSTWSDSKKVTITYPERASSSAYRRAYRIDGGDWEYSNTNKKVINVISNSKIEAAVAIVSSDGDNQLGEITVYNITTVDRLDPLIMDIEKEVTDTKDLCTLKAVIEDSESGLGNWSLTTSSVEPGSWEHSTEMTTTPIPVEFQITDNGTYYLWVRDLSGRATSEKIVVDDLDKVEPEIKSYQITYGRGEATLSVVAQDIELGLEAYAVLVGENTEPTESDWNRIQITTEEYLINYIVTQNNYYTFCVRDVSGKIAKYTTDFVKVKFNVTYDYRTNGGETISIPNNVVEVGCNTLIDLSPVSTREKGMFVGWNTDRGAEEGLAQIGVGTSEDVTLYAIFESGIEISLVYYDGNETITERVGKKLYAGQTSVEITLPEITKVYPGWIKEGWTTSTNKNATVEYTGENIKITTENSMILYMMYSKGISATYRYYNTTSVEKVNIRTNAYNIVDTTTKTIRMPAIAEEITVADSSNTWSLRGWSTSILPDAEILVPKNGQLEISENILLYASYESNIKANTYRYGATTPTIYTGIANMTYNGRITPAVIPLDTFGEINYKDGTWTPRGWSIERETNNNINVANGGNAIISTDTDYYAVYRRDIKLTTYAYKNEMKETYKTAYVNYEGTTTPAEFLLNPISKREINGKEWLGRGYSSLTLPNAEIEYTDGEKIYIDADTTFYASYKRDVKVTKEFIEETETVNVPTFASYNGTIEKAKTTLGEISNVAYRDTEWDGSYWSLNSSNIHEREIEQVEEVVLEDDTVFYAVYQNDFVVTKNTYLNQRATMTERAYLCANKEIEPARVELGTTANVTHGDISWRFESWSTSEDAENLDATLVAPNGTIDLYDDETFYSVYANNIDVKIYYLNAIAEKVEEALNTHARLNYAGIVRSSDTVIIPALNSVEKDGKTWRPLGYLASKDGYTESSLDGEISAGPNETTVYTTNGERYYAIYETDITLKKIEYDYEDTFARKVKLNVNGNKEGIETTLATAADAQEDGKIWAGNGWRKEISGENIQLPNGTVDRTSEDTTYVATYGRTFGIELQEYASLGNATSRFETISGTMDARKVKTLSTYTIPTPNNNTITLNGTSWAFTGWANAFNVETNASGDAGDILEIDDDIVLYARYGREIEVLEKTYGGGIIEGIIVSGTAFANTVGNVKPAEITLGVVSPVTNASGDRYEGRGWSTSSLPAAGANFIASSESATARVTEDTTYYASYIREITANFISYNGTSEVTKTRNATVYLNCSGEGTASSIVVPSEESYNEWVADGYTRSTEAKVEESEKVKGLITLYADADLYGTYYRNITLTYDTNGGILEPYSETGTQWVNTYDITNRTEAAIVITTNEPAKNGYRFLKLWKVKDDPSDTTYGPGETIHITDNTVLVAQYEEV